MKIIILGVLTACITFTYVNYQNVHKSQVRVVFQKQTVSSDKSREVQRKDRKTGGSVDKPKSATDRILQSAHSKVTAGTVYAQEISGPYKAIVLQEQEEIANKIRQVFGADAELAIAIARCESGLRPGAIGDGHISYWVNGVEYGKSYGVFQIRHLEGRPSPEQLLDADFNIQYAYNLFKRSSWYPWSAYNNGCYEQFLQAI